MAGPLGLILVAAAGIALGLVVGTTSGRGHQVDAATTPSVGPTSTTVAVTVPEATVEDRARIALLEQQLRNARQAQDRLQSELLDYQVDSDPVRYAPPVGCEVSVAQPQDFSEKAEWIGPVGFYDFTNEFTNFDGSEIFLTLEAGRSVTMVVPRDQRTSYSLFWDPSYTEGSESTLSGSFFVTLEACSDWPTTFIGGFDVTNSLCGTLDLYFHEGEDPKSIALPFVLEGCGEGVTPLLTVEPGPVPDVAGMMLDEARLQIRLAGLVPALNDGDPTGTAAVVVAQKPGSGEVVPIGSAVGFRTQD